MDDYKIKNNYTREELIKIRGEILHNMASVEMGISIYISNHFLGSANKNFIHTVLYDKYIQFIARVNIFEKILKEQKVDFPTSKLKRLGAIRNIFAHAWVSSPDDKSFNLIGKKNLEDIYDVEKLYDEFKTKYDEVINLIMELMRPNNIV